MTASVDVKTSSTVSQSQLRRRRRRLLRLAVIAASSLVAALAPMPFKAGATPLPLTEGMSCADTTNTSNSFVLTAKDGYITTPEGNSVYMWSYAPGSGGFQYPGPPLCVTADPTKTVTVTLHNQLPVPTSLVFTGIDGVERNGIQATPTTADLAAGNLTPSTAAGQAATYTFTVPQPGTYLYESGTSPELQDQMGLVGVLVVRPAGHPNQVYDDGAVAGDTASTKFDPTREYLHLLTEIDPQLHECFEAAATHLLPAAAGGTSTFTSGCPNVPYTFDMTSYKPRYWMINGRSFPDTIAPNNSQHLPSQPYSSLVHIQPRVHETDGPALIRYVNAGPVDYPFHPHAQHEQVVGIDGRKLVGSAGQDLTNDRFDIDVPPGSTMEAFFSWEDAVGWSPSANGTTPDGRPNFGTINTDAPGVVVPDQQNKLNGEYWSGTPYLGSKQDPLPGETSFNECGEFYDVAHSHALFQATNYGGSMGGMLTMIRIDPIGGCPS